MKKKEATKNTREFIRTLTDLFFRWLDEHEYENIDDYLKVIQKVEPRAYEMTEEPFGVKVKIEGKTTCFIVDIKDDNLIVGTIDCE